MRGRPLGDLFSPHGERVEPGRRGREMRASGRRVRETSGSVPERGMSALRSLRAAPRLNKPSRVLPKLGIAAIGAVSWSTTLRSAHSISSGWLRVAA